MHCCDIVFIFVFQEKLELQMKEMQLEHESHCRGKTANIWYIHACGIIKTAVEL